MSLISNVFYGFGRPLVLGVALPVGFGFMTTDTSSGVRGGDGFSCRGITSNADFNRMVCRLNPARYWNTPVADLIPAFKGE
jgi:hypothetical protein